MTALVHRMAAVKPDVLFVSAYLDDAIALRRELVAQHVPLLANIGTSSSYCLPAFGATLGRTPSASSRRTNRRRPRSTRRACPQGGPCSTRANAAYRSRFGTDMSAAALAGFSGAWALFTDVLPAAASMAPADVAPRRADGGFAFAGACPTAAASASGRPGTAPRATTWRQRA